MKTEGLLVILLPSNDNDSLEHNESSLSYVGGKVFDWKVATNAYEVECIIKEFFFSTSATRQRIVEEEAHLNQSVLLLSRSLGYCRFSDNNVFTLTTNLISQTNLSSILKEMESHYQS